MSTGWVEAREITDRLVAATTPGYNCTCQVGGVDAMSIDTDWLRHNAKALQAALDRAREAEGSS